MVKKEAVHTRIMTHALSKSFGATHAVRSVSLQVKKGEIYALVGPNGAGKSTFIKLLVGLLDATSGKAEINGYSIATEPEAAKDQFGYISDDPTSYEYLSGREFLELTGNLRRMRSEEVKHRIHELLSLFPLQTVIDMPMGQYSRGNRQKVAFLAALMAKPSVLIIDEPIVGLDMASIDTFGKTIAQFAKDGGSVFLATHILTFADAIAHRVGVMEEGKIVKEASLSSRTSITSLYKANVA